MEIRKFNKRKVFLEYNRQTLVQTEWLSVATAYLRFL